MRSLELRGTPRLPHQVVVRRHAAGVLGAGGSICCRWVTCLAAQTQECRQSPTAPAAERSWQFREARVRKVPFSTNDVVRECSAGMARYVRSPFAPLRAGSGACHAVGLERASVRRRPQPTKMACGCPAGCLVRRWRGSGLPLAASACAVANEPRVGLDTARAASIVCGAKKKLRKRTTFRELLVRAL